MTRAARYLDRLYREYPAVWRREKTRADKLGVSLLALIDARTKEWLARMNEQGANWK